MLERDTREIQRKMQYEDKQECPMFCMDLVDIEQSQIEKHHIVDGTITPFTRVLVKG